MGVEAQTEQALVGAIVTAPGKLVHVVDIVRPEDFTSEQARASFTIAVSLWRQKKTVDLVSVATAETSLAGYLAQATSTGSGAGTIDYAREVARLAKERRFRTGLQAVLDSPQSIEIKLEDTLALYQQEMSLSKKAPDLKSVMGRFNAVQKENRRSNGIPVGWPFMDEMYVQYVPGHIWVMGAYTSVGKTAVMVQKVCNMLVMDVCPSVVIISTEMTEEQLVARVLANLTGVHSQRILSCNYRPGEEEIIEEYKKWIQQKPLMIYDDVYTLGEIETAFRKADLQGGVNVGFVDYVQNCQVPEATSEYQAGSMLAKRLQQMAKDVRCTLICLSQVSNDVGRGNTEQLEFKGAGEWAAVADIGIHLQRKKDEKYKLRYQVKKNRHGRLFTQPFEYKADFTRLEPVAE